MDKTVNSWFGHNIDTINGIGVNTSTHEILICCDPKYYAELKSSFDFLSFPFKSLKIGIVDITIEYYFNFYKNEEINHPLLIFIGTELQANCFYENSNKGLVANSWIFVHPSLGYNQDYTVHFESDMQERGIKLRFLGHQNHITPVEVIEQAQIYGIEASRLGQIRQNIDAAEPWCRTVDNVIYHMDSMRKTDYSLKSHGNPGGFTYEEACKLSQFIGASSHLKSIAYLLPPDIPTDGNSFAVLSQLIWYLIDGYHNFREEKPIEKHRLTQYIVHASHRDVDINFWKNNESGRWWMEVPGHEHYWISCTYDDYVEASQGEFSSKLIHALNRI